MKYIILVGRNNAETGGWYHGPMGSGNINLGQLLAKE